MVKRVLVKDGDSVQAGQVLVELDATNASADQASVHEQLERRGVGECAHDRACWRRCDRPSTAAGRRRRPTRAHRRLSCKPSGKTSPPSSPSSSAEQARREAEIATVREVIAKLEATLPIARQREADFKSLTDQGFMSSHAGQDRTRERIEQERDLATQRARLPKRKPRCARAEQPRRLPRRDAAPAERAPGAGELKRQQLTQERSKTEQRQRLTQLTAPVAGTVQQVAVHTEGGVVTPAQVLMVIVPKDAQVTAEVVDRQQGHRLCQRRGRRRRSSWRRFRSRATERSRRRCRRVTADAVNDEKRGRDLPGDADAWPSQHRCGWQADRAEPGDERDGGDQDGQAPGDRVPAQSGADGAGQ